MRVRNPPYTLMYMDIQQIKDALRRKTPMSEALTPKDLLSTGSTLLNLAISGMPNGGLMRGGYHFFVGDSSSGKTWLSMTCFAEACRRKSFDDYELWLNDSENGALMDFARYYGQGVADRVEVTHIDMLDDAYTEIYKRLQAGKKIIAVWDSMDSLNTNEEEKRMKARVAASESGKAVEQKGTYGMEKAKTNSIQLRGLMGLLRDTGSILTIISQTRDNIDPNSYETKTRAGGKALKFYSCVELWTSVAGKIKKTVRDTERQVGIRTKIQVKKNRVSGKEWVVEVPIFHSYGIDDIGSCVDYLTTEKHWKKAATGGKITATDWGFEGTREALIKKIEAEDLETELRGLVADVWADIEEACKLKRKPRYT